MNTKVKLAIFNKIDLAQLDPAKIVYADQANYLMSMYSTLVYFDQAGKIKPGAASKFEVNGSKILFHIRDNMKSANGTVVDAEDVYLSLKRLLILNQNTHGKLSDFIYSSYLPQKITDACSGIRFEKNIFEVTLKSPKYVTFFLPVLASSDFSILPKNAVEYSLPNMPIKDFKNTSGAYYIDSLSEKSAVFKQNKSNYLIDNRNPDEIEMIFNMGHDRDKKFTDGELDIIPSFSVLTGKHIEKFGDLSNYNLYKTLPINTFFVNFRRQGPDLLSKKNV